jgi:ribonuclease HI
MKVIKMEMQNCKIELKWIRAHAGHHGNELADKHAKEAATSREINECYKTIPKITVLSELREYSATKWQGEWDHTTKGAITSFFSQNNGQVKIEN